jgi:hypothetical protein
MKKEDMRDLPDAAEAEETLERKVERWKKKDYSDLVQVAEEKIISNLKLMKELDGIEAREDERDKIEAAQDPSDEDDERNLDTGWGKEW